MRHFIFALLLVGFSTAQADMIKPIEMKVTCTGEGDYSSEVVEIRSAPSGSYVSINGIGYASEQLVAGTEGAGPYLQAVSNTGGYNISMGAGALETAFYEGGRTTIGSAKAYIELFERNVQFNATCVGSYFFAE